MRENKWDQQVSPPIYSSIPQYPAFPSGLGTRHPGNLQDVNLQLVDSELYIIGGVHNTYLNGSGMHREGKRERGREGESERGRERESERAREGERERGREGEMARGGDGERRRVRS